MSTKVKERLKRMALEMSHEERLLLDEAMDKLALQRGIILVTEQSKEKVRGCDILIEEIPDDQLIEIVKRIKKKKKKQVLVEA